MTTGGTEASEQKSLEYVNSCDLEAKVNAYPLPLTMTYFHVLGELSMCAVYKPSIVFEKLTFNIFSHMSAEESQTDLSSDRQMVNLRSSFEQTW